MNRVVLLMCLCGFERKSSNFDILVKETVHYTVVSKQRDCIRCTLKKGDCIVLLLSKQRRYMMYIE